MTKIYRKTATIKAEQFNDTNDAMFVQIVRKYKLAQPEPFSLAFHLPTLNGDMRVNYGDWIVTGDKGEHWAITDDVFKRTYAELPVIPRDVDIYIQLSQIHDLPIGHAFMFAETLDKDAFNWIVDNSDAFARAWLDGYTVEEDK